MSHNSIAVYGHRGWASSKVVSALAASSAPIKVLYRSGSDISSLPSNVAKIEVDVNDEAALVAALQGIDIVISLVGHEGVTRQHAFIKAIPKTAVKLFSPSDLAARYEEEGLRIGVNAEKDAVEKAAQEAGIPTTVVLTGNFAEFAINTYALGVDYPGNRIIFTGESATQPINLCTRDYVGAAYASIFASTPISQLSNRCIGLSELKPTGNEIADAFEKKHGRAPLKVVHSSEKIDAEVKTGLEEKNPFTLAFYCRKIWGSGKQVGMVGKDLWEVEGYEKSSLEDLILKGKLGQYRPMPPPVLEFFEAGFR
ncbi:NmrA-like family protein [Coleophoma cylindrospora]|uniref:NmrA-like family protein n=1 Tax=Coleophoma cylindrospora TaxID=1849047 RepID=A0A3D8QP08_9HELO|nr:NmrA-like family protein [Coleophoma cylindrospora]